MFFIYSKFLVTIMLFIFGFMAEALGGARFNPTDFAVFYADGVKNESLLSASLRLPAQVLDDDYSKINCIPLYLFPSGISLSKHVTYKDLVVSFVSILKQVAERRLPKAYDYHQMPAPFIQIKLLKILALLGNGDKRASGQMYTVVGDIMRKSDTTSNIGNAILYEWICCVASIFPNTKLLEAAADAISKFLKSDSHNLKYMGIDALGRLIKISPDISEQHEHIFIRLYCTDGFDGKNVLCNCQRIGEPGKLAKLGRETNVQTINLLSRLNHPYVVKYKDAWWKINQSAECIARVKCMYHNWML